jgi:SAM-dependent methyltransferase
MVSSRAMDELRDQRRLSFASVAEDYERSRPGYPREAVEWALGPAPRLVADIGAGTGKLTRQLTELGHTAVAVDPLPEMLHFYAHTSHANLAAIAAAENLPFRASSLDALVAAQAYHWFDETRVPDEFARVLKPDGTLALIWNFRDEDHDWVARLSEVIGSETMDATWSDTIEELPHFAPLEHRVFYWRQPLDRTALRALVRSRSYVASLDQAEQDRVLNEVEMLTREHPDLRDRETFELPYGCSVHRAFRA